MIPLSTPQSTRVVDNVASRNPQPEMLIGSIINKPSAGRPTISAEKGAVVPNACRQHQNAVSAIMCVQMEIVNWGKIVGQPSAVLSPGIASGIPSFERIA